MLRGGPDPEGALQRALSLPAALLREPPSRTSAALLHQGGYPARLMRLLDADTVREVLADIAVVEPETGRLFQLYELFDAALAKYELGEAIARVRTRVYLSLARRELEHAPLEEVGGALSDLAASCIQTAMRGIDPKLCEQVCVFGMGKLGARELNFLSDIDLVFVHTDEATEGPDESTVHRLRTHLHDRLRRVLRLLEGSGVWRPLFSCRSAPAPVRLARAALDLGLGVGALLRAPRSWLGAAGVAACAAGRRQHRARRGAASSTRALRVAAQPRADGVRRSHRDDEASARAGPREHRLGERRSQARRRWHPRDRVLRAEPAAAQRRPRSQRARSLDARRVRPPRGGRAAQRSRARDPRASLSCAAAHRASRAALGGAADPSCAERSDRARVARAATRDLGASHMVDRAPSGSRAPPNHRRASPSSIARWSRCGGKFKRSPARSPASPSWWAHARAGGRSRRR